MISLLGQYFIFIYQVILNFRSLGESFPALFNDFYEKGIKSFPLVFLTSLSVGMVMTLQFGYGLGKFGVTMIVPRLVTVTILREMGPVFTCLILAAKLSAGIAAEVASMKVTSQLDALVSLSLSPYKKIFAPKIFSVFLITPVLCVFANFFSILGVFIIAVQVLNLEPHLVLQKIREGFLAEHFFSGLSKSVFFGWMIGSVGCFWGIQSEMHSDSVGKVTTKAVVTVFSLIILLDFIITRISLLF